MAESLITRVKRIISGNVQDAVDAMERAGGASVMREAIREVERVVDEVRSERDAATAKRLQAVRQQSLYGERITALDEKAAFAMNQGREDLAEAALLRQVEFEGQVEALKKLEEAAGEEERQLEESVAALAMRKAQMEEELAAFEAAQREAGAGGLSGVTPERQKERTIEKAEAAFDRAMSSAGGNVSAMKADLDATAKLHEIDALEKSSVIAERMEALRLRRGSLSASR